MYCPECGNAKIEEEKKCLNCGHRFPHLKRFFLIRLAIFMAVIAVMIIGGNLSWRYHKMESIKKKLAEAIGQDAGYTETILKLEDESSNITYQEFFSLCDESIQKRTSLIIELRGCYPEVDFDLKEKLIQFLNAENDLVRSKKSFYQSQVQLKSILNLSREYLLDVSSALFMKEYYLKRIVSLKTDLLTALSEIVESTDDFTKMYSKLLSQEAEIAPKMMKEKIKFNPIFKEYEESNIKLAQEKKTMLEEFQKKIQSL